MLCSSSIKLWQFMHTYSHFHTLVGSFELSQFKENSFSLIISHNYFVELVETMIIEAPSYSF